MVACLLAGLSPWTARAADPPVEPTIPTVASTSPEMVATVPDRVAASPRPLGSREDAPPPAEAGEPVARALKAIADCRERYRAIADYTCTFYKRERIDGRLNSPHVMQMKARSRPESIYFRFVTPTKGREAIYVAGRHNGRVLAHDVGIGKLLAGTLVLDPRGARAMEDCRHPITEAGIGALIETVAKFWALELSPGETVVHFAEGALVGTHPCTLIETIHPEKRSGYQFHKVKLYISREHGVPIRYEAYDWPRRPGAAPELMEEYTYHELRVNVGLRDIDFDATNPAYTFGRF